MKKSVLYIFLILFVFVTFSKGIVIAQTSNSSAIVKTEFCISAHDSLRGVHVSNPVETENGLIVAYRAFKGPDWVFGIWLSHYKNGKWSSPKELIPPTGPENEKTQYVLPALQNWPDGSLKLFYQKRTPDKKRYGMIKTSFDSGNSWSDGIRLQKGIKGPSKNKPRILDERTIIIPSASESNDTDRFSEIHLEKSTDSGITWKKIKPPYSEQLKSVNTTEPCILIHPNNILQTLCRSDNGCIIETWSYDNGETWSTLKPTKIPNPNSGFDALLLEDGNYLLVYNHSSVSRNPLNIAISQDGINWEAALVLENDDDDQEYSYPSIIQTADGLIHVTYTWQQLLIKHVVIDPAKLKSVPLVEGVWPEQVY